MSFVVTFGNSPAPGPIAIDQCEDLESALAHACRLLSEGRPNVTIVGGDGRQISGDDLVKCCEGSKRLNHDLTVS